MKKLILITCIGLLAAGALYGQKGARFTPEQLTRLDTYEDTIALLAYAVVNDSLPEYRFGACQKLITSLKEALKTPNSFYYPFKRAKSISIQYPSDSSFRVFTWQLYVDVNEYRYYGAIQKRGSELELFPLIDRSHQIEEGNLEQMVLPPEQWYGSVYYNIRECKGPNGKYYLLFGYDGYRFFHKRKLIDVLSFDEKGQPVFGAPVFVHKPEGKPQSAKNRVLLQYTAEASVKLNYDESYELIIFDHLITMMGQYGEGPVNLPDGSYDGYKFQKGLWVFIDKVFNDSQDQAPVPQPLFDEKTKKKDIFGNDKN